MFLLDTNVVSELRRVKPHGGVLAWLQSVHSSDIFVSAVTVGEIQRGIEITRETDAPKALVFEAWLTQIAQNFQILAMDASAFRLMAKMMHRKSDDLFEDAMIAAIARCNDLIVVTRNERDFTSFEVKTFNPFTLAETS